MKRTLKVGMSNYMIYQQSKHACGCLFNYISCISVVTGLR